LGQTLILDSEAIHALANPGKRGALALRSRAILDAAHGARALVRVPAPVLAEVCRGGSHDAAIAHVLNSKGIGVVALTETIAKRAGALLSRAKLGSAHAVDAFVVATAAEFRSAMIATGDPKDFRQLLATLPDIRLFAI
jgi:predicted nucleic acid-binding protein